MVVTAPIMIVAGLIKAYTGYKRDTRKEDDLAIRRRLMSEIAKSKENIKNILEEAYEKRDMSGSEAIKGALDELDIFSSEVDLSETGHKYPFFSPQVSITKDAQQKLIDFDSSLLTNMQNVTVATNKIADLMLDDEEIDLRREAKKVKNYITKARNAYRDRIELIRRLK